MASDDVFKALADHDQRVERIGRPIWIGAEPTYTDRYSEAPEWLFNPLGEDKYQRAQRLLGRLAKQHPGSAVLRSVGRQYAREDVPRWSLGVYTRRDANSIWDGPPDPLLTDVSGGAVQDPLPFAQALVAGFRGQGWTAEHFAVRSSQRVAFRLDQGAIPTDPEHEPLLGRGSVHTEHVEGAEIVDELAEKGIFLLVIREDENGLRAELPAVESFADFETLLKTLAGAGNALRLNALILEGYPPPMTPEVCWTTITADPAVIEVNMAPVDRSAALFESLSRLERSADEEGLSPYRLQYNGQESDSGGGGQVTLGGPSPLESPFLSVPGLLPSLVRYFNHHPALSYLHAFESLGPASQAPRVDEVRQEVLPELTLALELLERVDDPTAETIWATLAPFLVDPSGNSHRSEINIEKLWNPFLGKRGQQGLVEFRAFRMGPSAEITASLAALLRGIVAMLVEQPFNQPLVDWREQLHQRFSLPFFLHEDLRGVLADLDSQGFGLGAALVNHLMRDRDLLMTRRTLGESQIEIRQALEFWPLVGDVATQEGGGSRLVDASTSRIEVRLRHETKPESLQQWMLIAGNWRIPLVDVVDPSGPARLVGLRYRRFVPFRGLHPTLPSQSPLEFTLTHPSDGNWRFTLHEWEPNGQAYPGLPKTFAEASARRQARCVCERIEPPTVVDRFPPPQAQMEPVVDLRWQAVGERPA
jgi:uncharacterized protein (DUF2126 family)